MMWGIFSVRIGAVVKVAFLVISASSCVGTSTGTAELQINPKGVAYVKENNALTLTCHVTDISYTLFQWKNTGDGNSYDIYRRSNDACFRFSAIIDFTLNQFSCSGNNISWTIRNVTRQQHGDELYCMTNDLAASESSKTRVFVIATVVMVVAMVASVQFFFPGPSYIISSSPTVPVTAVSFSIPTSAVVTVIENNPIELQCTTSAERPSSTVQWYITGNPVSLGTGTNTRTDNDTTTSTTSKLSFSFDRTADRQQLYCTAFNVDGQIPIVSGRKNLVVEFPPSTPIFKVGAQQISGNLSVVNGDDIRVTCDSDSHPAPHSYKWTGQSSDSNILTINNIHSAVTRTCTATNTMTPTVGNAESRSSSAALDISVMRGPTAPVLSYRSSVGSTAQLTNAQLHVIKGTDFSVNCSGSSSIPSPTYRWTSHTYRWTGEKMSNYSMVSFNNIDTTDHGQYVCTVENTMVRTIGNIAYGNNSNAVFIEILIPPTTHILKVGTQEISGNLSVVNGDNIRVICDSDSDSGPPSYRWTGGPTTPVLSYRSSSGSTTQLPDAQLRVIKGTDFSLVCSGSSSNPSPTYRWSGKKTSNNNTVPLNNIDTIDDGQYVCIVENTMVRTVGDIAHGNNSNRVVIEILIKPEVDVLPDTTVTENQPLSIHCKANGNPQPTNYTWTRSKDDFQLKQPMIYIQNTRRDDTDIYICTVRNNMLPTVGVETFGVGTGTMNVTVLYHPDVTVSPLNGTTMTETATNVILLCSALGEPAEYTFSKWVQYAPDGITKVNEYDSSRIEVGKSYLVLTPVSYMDSGIYHCFVRNGIEDYRTGNVIATNNTVQNVKGKPIVTDGVHDVAAPKHENSSIIVDFYSNDGSDPSVKWYKIIGGEKHYLSNQDGKLFLETSAVVVNVKYYTVSVAQQGNRTHLLLQNISESDFGEYEVEIHNSIGSTSRWFNVVAQGAPDNPRLFRAFSENTTETSITLSWRSGFHGGANQTFFIQYKTSTLTWQNTMQVNGGFLKDTDFNITIDNLKSGTVYSFRIFAANMYGQSDFSAPIEASTIKSEAVISAEDSNTGAVVGGTIGGLLAVTVIVVIGIFLLRRGKGFPGSKPNFNSDSDSNRRIPVQETMTSSGG